jgi:hypothetical protein
MTIISRCTAHCIDARKLADLLAARGDANGLRARSGAGDREAARQLQTVLAEQGRTQEARQLRRFGLTPDGEIASPGGCG